VASWLKLGSAAELKLQLKGDGQLGLKHAFRTTLPYSWLQTENREQQWTLAKLVTNCLPHFRDRHLVSMMRRALYFPAKRRRIIATCPRLLSVFILIERNVGSRLNIMRRLEYTAGIAHPQSNVVRF